MVNRRTKPAQTLKLVRIAARAHGLTVTEIPGAGKGSHVVYALIRADGSQVARFGLTGHNRELSWTVLRQLEAGLAFLFGDGWLERR